jgi:hypothetical protein
MKKYKVTYLKELDFLDTEFTLDVSKRGQGIDDITMEITENYHLAVNSSKYDYIYRWIGLCEDANISKKEEFTQILLHNLELQFPELTMIRNKYKKDYQD